MTLDNGIVTVVNDNCAFSLLPILQSIVRLYCDHLLQLFLPPLKSLSFFSMFSTNFKTVCPLD